MLRRVLRTVAEFGVANLHLINTARVEKSYWQSPLLAPAKLEDALLAGMERASDTVMPLVHQHKLFRPFVEDQLSVLCAGRPVDRPDGQCGVPARHPAGAGGRDGGSGGRFRAIRTGPGAAGPGATGAPWLTHPQR